jgi:glycosyltransferase involved in cell wall biosynthesis
MTVSIRRPGASGRTSRAGGPGHRHSPARPRLSATDGRRLVYVVTVAVTAEFLRGQLRHMRSLGYAVTLIAAPHPLLSTIAVREGVTVRPVEMARASSPRADLRSLLSLVRIFRELRPDVVNFGTPKAGLLAGLAAVVCRVPRRVYTVHGLRLEGVTGMTRRLLTATEWVACRSAHVVVCVSASLRERVVAMRLASARRAVVLGAGSCNGVDTEHYRPATPDRAAELRAGLGIGPSDQVIGYVGRITRDKGLRELVDAYLAMRAGRPALKLLLVGEHDDTDPVDDDVRAVIDGTDGILRPGWVADPADYYHCMDVFVLPSYREGLGQTALEAAASGVPVVASDATGARDTVVDGVTGVRVPQRDAAALAAGLSGLIDDPERARRMGHAGRRWMCAAFTPARLWAELAGIFAGAGVA